MELNTNLQSVRQMDSLGMDILNHRKAAAFLNKAAQLHLEAAKQRLEGNFEEVAECMQGVKDLLHQVVNAMQQSGGLHWEGISEAAENETVQSLQLQYTAMRQYNKERY